MKGLVFWAHSTVTALGGTGLLFVSFLDSSFLTLPEAVDLLVAWLVVRNPHYGSAAYYVAMATLGSSAGCMVLYWVTRKGGEAFLRKRFAASRVDRGMALFRRYGLAAVFLPAVLPPPTPFKLFILLAGVSGVSPARFGAAIVAGRLVRFGLVGALALWLGDDAVALMREHGTAVGLALVGGLLAGILGYVAWRRFRPGRV